MLQSSISPLLRRRRKSSFTNEPMAVSPWRFKRGLTGIMLFYWLWISDIGKTSYRNRLFWGWRVSLVGYIVSVPLIATFGRTKRKGTKCNKPVIHANDFLSGRRLGWSGGNQVKRYSARVRIVSFSHLKERKLKWASARDLGLYVDMFVLWELVVRLFNTTFMCCRVAHFFKWRFSDYT